MDGIWSDGTPWGFYGYSQEVPPELPIRTGMCVPVRSLDPHNPQVMLTLNLRRGGWEIPGGHLDPLENGEKESASVAAARETREETGLEVASGLLVPYGYIEATNSPVARPGAKTYPPRTYMQFFGVHAPDSAGPIIDPEVDGAGTFTLDALHRMAERGGMKLTELQLTILGVSAVLRHHGVSDENIRMP